jgi:hypothetical protein
MPSNSIRRLVIFANEFSLYIKVDDRILINYLYQLLLVQTFYLDTLIEDKRPWCHAF